MAQTSSIEWTDATWNPVTGCTKISAGCENCYAERMARRLHASGQFRYKNGFKVTLHPDLLQQPLRWSKPRNIFVNSMSDLFHADVPLWFIKETFAVMANADWHAFQILTKRAERLVDLCADLTWSNNIWIGVTVENEDCVHRIRHLQEVPAAVRFVSLEPLLGPIRGLPLRGIDWVIVGGESGPGARYLPLEWVRTVRDDCLRHGVPFFFKQWGGVQKWRNGRELDGRIWEEMPVQTRSDSKHIQIPSRLCQR